VSLYEILVCEEHFLANHGTGQIDIKMWKEEIGGRLVATLGAIL
jgi:hypothetical protein